MNAPLQPPADLAAMPGNDPAIAIVGCWRVLQFDSVPSTNLVAARLPAWHAVRADCQTAGRGRFQRSWVSNRGGLWLSAVVPIVDRSPQAKLLPLTACLALCDALRNEGVFIRVRWPNDVLVGKRKLAGLLIDQFVPGLAVIGIGVNVTNRPEELDSELHGQAARLVDVGQREPRMDELLEAVLGSLEAVCLESQTLGPEHLLPRINALWPTPALVQVDLDGTVLTGQFEGVDGAGRLRLRLPGRDTRFFEPHQVRLLREIL